MRLAILCDGASVARWERDAIEKIVSDNEIFLLVAQNAPMPRRRLRHAAYYALNLVAIRNQRTRRVPFPDDGLPIAGRFDFEPGMEGNWAHLPDDAIEWLNANRIDAVIKFGLGLLRIPPPDRLASPILSFHHGDPSHYRGRPAGFYELLNGERFVGQIVQALSNRIDAGEILAFAQTRAHPHSYRKTLVDAFSLSPFLLPKALDALRSGERINRPTSGRNYRLPTTLAVGKLIFQSMSAALRRLGYGLFMEKDWRVATAAVDRTAETPLAAIEQMERSVQDWTVHEPNSDHRFLADPFFATDGSILVEALDRKTHQGAILRIDGDRQQRLTPANRHHSYPFTIGDHVVPEIAGWSRPIAYRLEGGKLVKDFDLDIDSERLVDPTLFERDGQIYLFANERKNGTSVLHLWHAASLEGQFVRHPSSPVRVSARGSRMAGRIIEWGGSLWRFGQDWGRGYGDGVLAFRIVEISPERYFEREEGCFSFNSCRGPHTIDCRGDELLFDFYREQVSPLAGYRRLLARL